MTKQHSIVGLKFWTAQSAGNEAVELTDCISVDRPLNDCPGYNSTISEKLEIEMFFDN